MNKSWTDLIKQGKFYIKELKLESLVVKEIQAFRIKHGKLLAVYSKDVSVKQSLSVTAYHQDTRRCLSKDHVQ